jgi:hypothetical protein
MLQSGSNFSNYNVNRNVNKYGDDPLQKTLIPRTYKISTHLTENESIN